MEPNTEKTAKDYEVGYKKPPKEHQFKKGQSGNPKGRPKGQSDPLREIRRAYERRVTVSEDGKQKHMSMCEVIATRFVSLAAKDPRLMEAALKLALRIRPDDDNDDDNHFNLIIQNP